MKKKLSLLILVISIVALTLVGCNSAINKDNNTNNNEQTQNNNEEDNNDSNNEEDLFKVGMEGNYLPFNWTQADDSNGAVKIEGSSEYAAGYDVEIAKIIADSLGKKLVVVKTKWDELIPSLTSGEIDAVIGGMSPTEERKETIDFTDKYYKSNLVMVVRSDSDYVNAVTLKDFLEAKITAQVNTFHYDVIDQIPSVNKVEAMDTFSEMRKAVENGTIDGYVTEVPEALSAEKSNLNLKMVELHEGFVISDEEKTIAIGIQKDSELKEKINEILKEISDEDREKMMNEAIQNQE